VSRNEIILAVFAAVLVGFSLVVSLVVPRRRPDFPTPRLGLFAVVTVALVVAMLAAVEVWGAEGEEGGAEHQTTERTAGAAPEEAPTGSVATGATATDETSTGEEGGGTGAGQGDAAAGKDVFASAGCGGCHTLADAGASGTTGPNLDELKPSFEAAEAQVREGGGGMPAFEGNLSDDEIANVAAYVAEAAGG